MTTPHNITSAVLLKAGKRPIHAGDDYDYTITVVRAGVRLDLTGAALWLTIKDNQTDPDAQALLQYTTPSQLEILAPATNGSFVMHFTASTTENLAGEWWYDIKSKLVTGVHLRIAWGAIEFLPNITKTRT